MSRTRNKLRVFKPKARSIPQGKQSLKIDGLIDDGRGVAKSDLGKTVFVAGGLPGETVAVKYLNSRKQFDEAEVVKVVSASEFRVEPSCPYYGRCGGCDLQHFAYSEQVKLKQTQLQRLFSSKNETISWQPAITAKSEHYRHRIRLSVAANKKGFQLGFKRLGSHQLIDVTQCSIADQAINSLLPLLREKLSQLQRRAVLQECVVSVDSTNKLAIHLLCKQALTGPDYHQLECFSRDKGLLVKVNLASDIYGPPLFEMGAGRLNYSLPNKLNLKYEVSDFTQVNVAINHLMIESALSWLELSGGDEAADFFCGIGNLTLPIASCVDRVTGYELVESMVNKARFNADSCRLANVEFIQADLFGSRKLKAAAAKVILDPPRAGAKELCELLAVSSENKILYISCNPSTLARDAEILQQGGYAIVKACLVDMFPHTKHMEAMMLFERPGGSS